MKRIISFLTLVIMLVSSFSVMALDINIAYYDFKAAHPDFVKSLTDQGLSEGQIITFVYDLYEYLKKIDKSTPVTEGNFEKHAVEAIFEVSSMEAHYPIQDALLILYPEAVKLAVTQSIVHEDFVPLVDTVKKILFASNEFGNTDKDSSNTGNTTEKDPKPPISDIPTGNTFTDIDSSHWAYNAISHLAANFILNGYLDGSFKPEHNITRAEFAKIIVSASNKYDYSATSSFTDVSEKDWYYTYVASAYKNGYITGYPDGSFRPDDNITRADICTIVGRATGKILLAPGISAKSFSDMEQIPEYAINCVVALTGDGIVNGYNDGSFRPRAYATRAQTAKIIYSAFFKDKE